MLNDFNLIYIVHSYIKYQLSALLHKYINGAKLQMCRMIANVKVNNIIFNRDDHVITLIDPIITSELKIITF